MSLPKVLLVDDLKANFEIASMVLEKNCELIWVDNGKDAIERLQNGLAVDLILLDIMMPVMNGYDVCRIIKADPSLKHIPILFVTALGEVRDDQLGIDLGASDYINRPFSPAILRARVSTYLSLNSKEKEKESALVDYTHDLFRDKLQLIECLAVAIDSRNGQDQYHVKRVAEYACVIARAAGLGDVEISSIRIAALLHDVGKITLPEVLLKQGHLVSKDEKETLKQHGALGAELFDEYSGHLFDVLRGVSRSHHEKWDGSGYPDNLKANEIPLAARIVAIADEFDRKTSVRSGKKVWGLDETITYLEHRAGDYYDPMLVPYVRLHEEEFRRICHDEYVSSQDRKAFSLGSIFKPKHH